MLSVCWRSTDNNGCNSMNSIRLPLPANTIVGLSSWRIPLLATFFRTGRNSWKNRRCPLGTRLRRGLLLRVVQRFTQARRSETSDRASGRQGHRDALRRWPRTTLGEILSFFATCSALSLLRDEPVSHASASPEFAPWHCLRIPNDLPPNTPTSLPVTRCAPPPRRLHFLAASGN